MNKDDADWVLLARVVRPQGRRGEVLAEIYTDFPESFHLRKRVFLRPPAGARTAACRESRVESQWLHKGRVVLKFAGIDSINDAETLRNCEVIVPRDERMPLENDAVYISDLIGKLVVDVRPGAEGPAGTIVDVEPEGAAPALLVVRAPGGEERLIPFVRAYLRRVDLEAGRVEMELPEGLLEMQAPAAAQPEDGDSLPDDGQTGEAEE